MVALNRQMISEPCSLAACRHWAPGWPGPVDKAKQRPHSPWSWTAARLISDGFDFLDFLVMCEEEEFLARLGSLSVFSL